MTVYGAAEDDPGVGEEKGTRREHPDNFGFAPTIPSLRLPEAAGGQRSCAVNHPRGMLC